MSYKSFEKKKIRDIGACKDTICGGFEIRVVLPQTKCKHGDYSCEKCGTSDRSDKKHTTLGGKGKVARLKR